MRMRGGTTAFSPLDNDGAAVFAALQPIRESVSGDDSSHGQRAPRRDTALVTAPLCR